MKNKAQVIKAVIVAGGSSKRIKATVPKQLAKIGRKPILAHTLDVFEGCKALNSIILVVNKKFIHQFRSLVNKYGYKKIEQLCPGGETRQQSVFNGLKAAGECDYVVIHDAVRPFVSLKIILEVIEAAKRFGAAACAVPATDTIVQAKKKFISKTLKREQLWHIQTPQAFKFALIFKAHQKAKAEKVLNASDDAQLVFGLKKKVKLIAGSFNNIKITTISDLSLTKKVHKSC